MKKNVKIITYCTWKSIGSILQAHALNAVLDSLGNNPELILEEKNRSHERKMPKDLKSFVKSCMEFFVNKKIDVARNKRSAFIESNMKVTYFLNCNEILSGIDENALTVYLAGSDQIWNPDASNPVYFLDFAKNERCISYAASMGKTKISEEKLSFFAQELAKFYSISVREKECADVLSGCTDKEIYVHIDPTFLIDVKQWRTLEKKYDVKEPYILLYMLYWDDACKKKISDLKKRTGLPVYAVCPGISRVYADKRFYDVGVEEFLWLVDHAQYVVTSSFHGVALSIIFQKKFAPVINPAAPSRIENLLRILDVPHVDIGELDRTDGFDYDAISANIERERQRSITYLKYAVE